MPLLKGKGKSAISSNISELVGLLFKTMFNMFHVFKRMAIRAKNFQIAHIIIFWISVFVMNTQNFWLSIVSTYFAFIDQPSSKHIFADRLKCGKPNIFFWFVYTCYAAINSWFRWICQKNFTTMFAITGNRTIKSLSFIITFATAIFCFIRSRRYVRKFIAANFTNCCNLNSCCQPFARSGAILETIKPVLWYIDKSFAMPARRLLPSTEF